MKKLAFLIVFIWFIEVTYHCYNTRCRLQNKNVLMVMDYMYGQFCKVKYQFCFYVSSWIPWCLLEDSHKCLPCLHYKIIVICLPDWECIIENWATPSEFHIPIVGDFGKVYHRGGMNFKMHLPSVWFLD